MAEPVVTELVVEADNDGAVAFARAMAAAEAAAQQAAAANQRYVDSLQATNDNARQAADENSKGTFGLKSLAQGALEAAESFAKKVVAVTAAVAILRTLFNIIAPIYIAYRVLKEAVELVSEAWRLGGERLQSLIDLSKEADSAGLSVSFWQKIKKGAEDAKLSVDDLKTALQKLNEQTTPRLGGTDAQKRLADLVNAGNFQGNTGVAQLASANTSEDRLRAIVSLIDQAEIKGERLAAIDVARSFLGDTVAVNLQKDSDYLDRMLSSAERVSAQNLISDADVARALDLQYRLDAAEKILSQRWHPIQTTLTSLGVEMRAAWVGIVEAVASAFDWVVKLFEKLSAVPAWFVNAFVNATTTPESRASAAIAHGIEVLPYGPQPVQDGPQGQIEDARRRLNTQNQIPGAIQRSQAEAQSVFNSVFRDISKDPAKAADDATSAYDRAEEALRKYVETTNAASVAVDATVGEQERLKAIAQLVAAGMKDGLSREAATAKANLSGLAQEAGQAAEALARAQVASQIKFGRNTAFLSQDDVQIATQLKSIYPDVATALGSVEAQGLRLNSAMRDLSTGIQNSLTSNLTDIATGSVTAANGFKNLGTSVVRSIEEMIIKFTIVTPLARAFQAAIGGFNLFGGNPVGVVGAAGSLVVPTFAAGGTLGGGWGVVGEQGAELINVHSGGVTVFPHEVSKPYLPGFADGGSLSPSGNVTRLPGSSQDNAHVTFIYSPSIDARGQPVQDFVKLAKIVGDSQRDFTKNVIAVGAQHRANTPGSNR